MTERARFHARVLNIPGKPGMSVLTHSQHAAYREGHRDARHAAAEIASEADALAEAAQGLRVALQEARDWIAVGGVCSADQQAVDRADAALSAYAKAAGEQA